MKIHYAVIEHYTVGKADPEGRIEFDTPWDATDENHHACIASACAEKVKLPEGWEGWEDQNSKEMVIELFFPRGVSLGVFDVLLFMKMTYLASKRQGGES